METSEKITGLTNNNNSFSKWWAKKVTELINYLFSNGFLFIIERPHIILNAHTDLRDVTFYISMNNDKINNI